VSGATAYYTPNTNFYGSDSFTIYAYGPGGNATAATVNVTVGKPPAPTAGSGSISAGFNTSGSTTLAGSGALISSYQVASGPAQGTVAISGSTVTYTPNPNTYGSDSFTYTVTNPGGTSSPATISVTIAKPPAPTVANGSISTAFDTPGSTTLAGSGALISSYQAASNPAHGTVSISGSTVTYTPNPTYYGTDSFSYTATNPGGTSSPATITVTVARPPAPTAANGAISTAFDTPGSTVLAGSGALVSSYQVGSGPAHGSVSIVGSTVTYTPTTDYYGADSFTYTVSNPGGTSRPATISVTVAPPPIPVAQSASVTTPYLSPVTVPLAASGALISGYALATQPANGTVALSGSTATYTPNALFWGQDSFTFVATNPGGTSVPATISITVQLPPPPVVVSSNTTTPYQTPVTITLTSTGVGSTFAIASQPSLGVATLSGNVLTYTPNWGTAGVDTLTVTVSGPGGTSQPTNIYVTNEPPPLPQGAGSYTGAPIPSSGASTAVCPAVGTAAIPGLPGPPTGTAYDPNWCEEQALNIAQHALQLQNQLSQIANLQSQTEAQQKSLQALGSDATSPTLATINTAAAKILAQATGIGFNSASSGAAFAAAYPPSSTVAGFNNTQLSAALGAWQSNTAAALNTAVQVQNAVAQARASTTTAIQSAVTASNAAPGDTAAVQATNQLLAAITTQLGQLQDILVTEGQAQTAVDAAQQGAAGAAQAAAAQSSAATAHTLAPPPGVSNTDSL
jgi:P-type conjugative transfer protein TrbJ